MNSFSANKFFIYCQKLYLSFPTPSPSKHFEAHKTYFCFYFALEGGGIVKRLYFNSLSQIRATIKFVDVCSECVCTYHWWYQKEAYSRGLFPKIVFSVANNLSAGQFELVRYRTNIITTHCVCSFIPGETVGQWSQHHLNLCSFVEWLKCLTRDIFPRVVIISQITMMFRNDTRKGFNWKAGDVLENTISVLGVGKRKSTQTC